MARKKIVADDILEEAVDTGRMTGGVSDNLEDDKMTFLRQEVNAKLDEAKGKFTAIAIVGVTEDGSFDLVTNVSQYSYLQWLLGKGSFELFIHEKNANTTKAA